MTENVRPAPSPEAPVRVRGFKDLHEGILGEFAERGAFAVDVFVLPPEAEIKFITPKARKASKEAA